MTFIGKILTAIFFLYVIYFLALFAGFDIKPELLQQKALNTYQKLTNNSNAKSQNLNAIENLPEQAKNELEEILENKSTTCVKTDVIGNRAIVSEFRFYDQIVRNRAIVKELAATLSESNVLIKDQTIYTWKTGTDEGITMPMQGTTESVKQNFALIMYNQLQEDKSYSCFTEDYKEMFFTLPDTVTFSEPTEELMEELKQIDNPCELCANLDGSEQIACMEKFQCTEE